MKITKALFAGSSQLLKDKPKQKLPEFAFIGRSNVGKSSLINSLCGVKGLAKTSATPGKTLLVNHFLINDSWYLVDLPGYGYAKVSQAARAKLAKMNNNFINNSPELVMLFVLLDSRHNIQKIDLEFLISLGEAGIPFAIIFTKADKLGKVALQKQIDANKKELLKYWEELPPVFVTSSESHMGKDEVTDYIYSILETL
ncbi:MAG: YihA family ribosome biogenesis GTP-binding protein [Bacteroidales bacterium]|jgi:GTP-binding protein|nr:YihA family ribosome biogenesis GTP-binding protein [Bacteroidales bacterium]MBQ1930164.1 YihA family ribosome biogenesis GTP-binding protein [Bacteroidales bacterium]MBQ5783900.1 YihA family ribosome biogenesis GTP-binding protein [Bacteroidales bacterium]MBR6540879.1 YihA family ribosome biogenesis GTP-binding protein [Bacteroidales bacterium]